MVDEIMMEGQVYRRVKSVTYVDLRFDSTRKRDGFVAMTAIVKDKRMELWIDENASLTEVLHQMEAFYSDNRTADDVFPLVRNA